MAARAERVVCWDRLQLHTAGVPQGSIRDIGRLRRSNQPLRHEHQWRQLAIPVLRLRRRPAAFRARH